MLRTYEVKTCMNKGKKEKILSVIEKYRKTASVIAKKQWELFYKEGNFNKNHPVKEISSAMSERYKQVIAYQVISILDSFISNIQNDFRKIVTRSTISEEERIKLLYINKYKLWFKKEVSIPACDSKGNRIEDKFDSIDSETLKLGRVIMKHILSLHRRPTYKHINMALDNKVAVISKKDSNKAHEFDYWIRFSTLTKNKPVYIPLKSNPYFEEIKGKTKKFCQINIDRDGNIKINLIKDREKSSDYVSHTPEIALDIGLKNLFATDRGDLFGREFKEKLIEYDKIITTLQSNLQKQQIKPLCSRRYRELIRKLRAHLKNEVCRIINKIIRLYKPGTIIVEKLNFTSPNLSKRMNRILSKFGKREIENKFTSISEEFGIAITYINPAYTSQECSRCGYIDKGNRKNREEFICKLCNLKLHADVNGARCCLKRSSLKEVSIYKSKKSVLRILTGNFLRDMER
ncbi:MAG: zinc ribbon domain-containing protein, partial [Candidatus Eremiobacterota bacterium]